MPPIEDTSVTLNTNQQVPSGGVETPAAPARPDYIPEKFWDAEKGQVRVEDLAKSYGALETKLGSSQKQPAETTPPAQQDAVPGAADQAQVEALAAKGVKYADLQTEFMEKGELSQETYAKLEKAGFSKEDVDGQIGAIQAQAELYRIKAFEGAGLTPDRFEEMIQWAATGMSQEDIAAYNRQTAPGASLADATAALKNLAARFEQANGSEPQLLNLKGQAPAADIYSDHSQMQDDMRDPRYEKSQAFRDYVAQKLARSSI